MKFTEEQEAIINSTGNLRVNAIAGSGKSSTLVEFAKRRPDKTFLYLVFNRSAKLDAIEKFRKNGVTNVEIHTGHSLGYKHIVYQNGYTVSNNFSITDIKNMLGLSDVGFVGYILANHITNLMELYLNNLVDKPEDIDYISTLRSKDAIDFCKENEDIIVDGVIELIKRMDSNQISVSHNFYLKKYQQSKPKLNYDYILVDEFQDSNQILLDIVLNQDAIKICVGDSDQQLYSWRYAINAFSHVDFEEFFLTRSFRFNQTIADIAMRSLSLKKLYTPSYTPVNIVGSDNIPDEKDTYTILARTNLCLLDKAINLVSKNEVDKIYFEGNLSSYQFMSNISVYDVYNLYHGNKSRIRNPLIKKMKSFSDLESYIEQSEDRNLNMLIQIVKEYGTNLPKYFKKLTECNVPDTLKHTADRVFSTVHRIKGLESTTVELLSDFVSRDDILAKKQKDNFNPEKMDEEINILYVSLTRAKTNLILPSGLEYLRNEQE